MYYKGLHWDTYSSGFLSDRSYQNGSLSRMESKVFIFKGKLLLYSTSFSKSQLNIDIGIASQ